MVERRVGSETDSLTPDHYKSGIDLISVCAGKMQHTVGKLLRKTTSLLQNSSQSEVWAGSYELSKSRESKPGQFRDSSLGVSDKKSFGCRSRREYYMGEGGGFPRVRVMMSQVSPCCPWLVLTPMLIQKWRLTNLWLVLMQDRVVN
jgi:hypothetical protein